MVDELGRARSEQERVGRHAEILRDCSAKRMEWRGVEMNGLVGRSERLADARRRRERVLVRGQPDQPLRTRLDPKMCDVLSIGGKSSGAVGDELEERICSGDQLKIALRRMIIEWQCRSSS